MDTFELSLEILKIVVSKENFKGLELDEKKNKSLDLFEAILKKTSELAAKYNSTNCNSKTEKLLEVHRRISQIESLNDQDKNVLFENAAKILIQSNLLANPSNGNGPSDKNLTSKK